MKKRFASFSALALFVILHALGTPAFAQSKPARPLLKIVAAENFYGDVAAQLGGNHVTVHSVLSNPSQDPHLFEADPSTARALSAANLVIYNGANYDPWMGKLLRAAPSARRTVLVVADLIGKQPGDNPHLWYAPQTMPALAQAIHQFLATADPENRAEYDRRYQSFAETLKPIANQVAQLRKQYAGLPVTSTEPVFGYMAEAIGLAMRHTRLQLAVMNGTEPSAQDIAAIESDLQKRQVHALIYNSQAADALTRRLLKQAQDSRIPLVQVTETEPPRMTYQTWMLSQLKALASALGSYAQ